jgi:hypothetical protein
MALAHTLLVVVFHLLRDGGTYRELGPDFFDRRSREATAR